MAEGAGGGGAGWFGSGGDPIPFGGGLAGKGGLGPPTFAGGYGAEADNGGFGGGGGDGFNGAGGGGGHSGGGGSGEDFPDRGGGGSCLDSSFTNTTLLPGANAGNGYVTISEVPAPEPGSVIFLLMGMAGLGLRARRSLRG